MGKFTNIKFSIGLKIWNMSLLWNLMGLDPIFDKSEEILGT